MTSSLLSDGSFDYNQGISRTSGSSVTSTHADMLGSLKLETNSSGTVTASREFDAFGNLVQGANNGMLGYAGAWGYEEDASGLKLLGHRWYDSFSGRFLTRDPAQDGSNWYEYAGDDPLGNVDPSGLEIVIQGGTKEQRDSIRRQLHRIGRSKPLRQMIYVLIHDKKKHYISPLLQVSSPGEAYSQGAHIYYDPDHAVNLPRGHNSKLIPFAPSVVLAHELGHQIGKKDEGNLMPPEPGRNVHDVENPYRRWLGQPRRYKY